MKKYDVIYSDPAYRFSSRAIRSGRYGELPYPTMTIKEICNLKVKDISNTNAALFLWVPGALIMEAKPIFPSWGFKYIRVEAIWEKLTVNSNKHKVVSPWGCNEAEYLLMGVKGSMCGKQTHKANWETIVSEPYNGKHSSKPHIFRERIEKRFSWANRLEMFAREAHENWSIWGNELKNDIEL